MYELRDYQLEKSKEGLEILIKKNIVYYSCQVRTGKTAIALNTCKLFGASSVLFLTKLKAIESIKSDYIEFGFDKHFDLYVINDESMHKIENPDRFDIVIYDEKHRHGSIPKPGKATKLFKSLFYNKPQIWLSGTPSPENFSQLYHQFFVTEYSPWKRYANFYRWANDYVDKKVKFINSMQMTDYSKAYEDKVMNDIKPYMVYLTQKDANFSCEINEHILIVDMQQRTYDMCDKLLKDSLIEGKEEVILADTGAKMQQKLHQMYSGTIKFESGNRMVFDTSKAEFIKNHFEGKKIAIFYVFIAERDAIVQAFGADNVTSDIEEFNTTNKHIALQVVSGREGTNLSKADCLVFYNIAHSATSYWQARDRMTTLDRKSNDVYWVFSRKGIESKIYGVVKKKKQYTLNHFKKDYNIK